MMKILKFIRYFWADVNHRRCSLVGAGILGLLFALVIYYFSRELNNKTLQSSITILALGLPTFYVLWKFRTHDVRRQIDKVQEQIAKTEENTNNSTFFECARMLTEEKSAEGKSIQYDSLLKKTALEQLAYLKMKTGFDKNRIDSLTTGGLDLIKKNFNSARFNGLDLSIAILNEAKLAHAELTGTKLIVANLREANLSRADLTEAKLNGADLTGAKLFGTKLIKADLSGANLSGAVLFRADLTGAKLTGAKLTGADLREANLSGAVLFRADLTGAIYDDKTKFNGTIYESREMRGKADMIYRPDEPA